ncbi:hypothetical protein BC939DRAFT_113691 [Gamsiella multidivaricata]|uniref:uncharacterized protein n=1 Tax=Gamsiella multidivaricata TaxID=101098 RepID=UPI0022203407|nr:uncharacterized protein BC939DRAFT_113691 [Gamsiella multidivaricata]KAI7826575.1 hypothetical protein BC939DRAFT_113691 [Gamsiella multidivaricata]
MTNNTQQPIATPTSPSLPSLPASEPSSLATSPALSQSSSKFKPQPINIIHSKSLEPPQSSPRRGSIAAHLMHFAAKSTSSLHLLSSSAPARSGPGSASSQEVEVRSQVLPLRSTFSNPFKKLQNTFQGNSSSSKKSPDLGALKATERIASSSSSVNSMVSWRSKGAEIFSKKTWGRSRKISHSSSCTSFLCS